MQACDSLPQVAEASLDYGELKASLNYFKKKNRQ